ncbi:hypothetical protein SDC9_158882 [bioreactor metagenome]|uniref:Uncharacterized protein n=1 Tax=bioreactor metagenome TaxID=1076179 RepID=A0A645FDZ7_9ZZZZ
MSRLPLRQRLSMGDQSLVLVCLEQFDQLLGIVMVVPFGRRRVLQGFEYGWLATRDPRDRAHLAPHSPQRILQLPGKPRRIEQGTLHETRPHTCTQMCERNVIGSKTDRSGDIVIRVVSHPRTQSCGLHDARPLPCDQCLTAQGQRRHSHPQRFAAGRTAGIREGVEDEIDFGMRGQICEARGGRVKTDPVQINPAGRQTNPDTLDTLGLPQLVRLQAQACRR